LIDLRVIQTDSSQINTTDFERKRNAPVVNESDRADAQRRVVAFSLFVSNAGRAPAFFFWPCATSCSQQAVQHSLA